jgi:hypothetical protein
MPTTPKSRSGNTKTASRSRSASTARRRATPKPAPAPEPSTISKLKGPLIAGGATVAGIAGIAGGIALRAKARPRHRLPSLNGFDLKKVDMKKTRKQVGRASKEFGAFTRELRKAGEQAERFGNALD